MSHFIGDQAKAVVETAQNILMDYLRGQLNDAAGSYQSTLGKDIAVTPSEETANQLYNNGAGGTPFVEITLEKRETVGEWRQPDGSGGFEVERHIELLFLLDMSMSDHAAKQTGPTHPSASDRKLVDAVNAIIETGDTALSALGVEEAEIEANSESQRAATKRNPHLLQCLVSTLTSS